MWRNIGYPATFECRTTATRKIGLWETPVAAHRMQSKEGSTGTESQSLSLL
jgi:hypothetical protein